MSAEPLPPVAQFSSILVEPHRRLLLESAVPVKFARGRGVRSVLDPDGLPPELGWTGGVGGVPGLLFAWAGADGVTHWQLRPNTPVLLGGDVKPRKYLQGRDVRLLNVLGDPHADSVWLVEGTKQSLAAAAYAPADVCVVGLSGCRGAMADGNLLPGLDEIVEDKDVVVVFDADVATNPNVWDAANDLRVALEMEGAKPRFVQLPGKGKEGLDDILVGKLAEKRPRLLGRLIGRATPNLPARPARLPVDAVARADIDVSQDRLVVVNEITDALVAAFAGTRLFDHGDAISELTGRRLRTLERGHYKNLLIETSSFFRPTQKGRTEGWPDGGTIEAVSARYSAFPRIERLASVAFVRPDGSVCQAAGYDKGTQTYLLHSDVLAAIDVPEEPTDGDVRAAVALLLDEWLGDFPLAAPADRANLLALLLTPFVRSLVPLVPLAVADGLQMGVGKNLLADVLSIVITGDNAYPLPFPSDNTELGKVITSTFATGADMFVFDEAHVLAGPALARVLTATTWIDRILGLTRMVLYPNRVTWMALGNNVRVEGDIVRRVYRIALHPTDPRPETRDASSFRHADLRGWTREHRADLISAALVLVRRWFAEGQPTSSRGVNFGSFEQWDRIVGGILEAAGVPGFLDNLEEWRGDTDLGSSYWESHLRDLDLEFERGTFTAREVIDAMNNHRIEEGPPDLDDQSGPQAARKLGQAYHRVRGRWFGRYRIVRAGTAHNNRANWKVEVLNDPTSKNTGPATPWQTASTAGGSGWWVASGGAESDGRTRTTSTAPSGQGATTSSSPSVTIATGHEAPWRGPPTPPIPPEVPQVPATPSEARALEAALARTASWMTDTGLRVDVDLCEAAMADAQQTREDVLRELTEEHTFPAHTSSGGPAAHPWSTQGGRQRLGKLAGDVDWPRRADGRPDLTNATLNEVAATCGGHAAGLVATAILKIRDLDPIIRQISDHHTAGRIHPRYSMATVTARWTATAPNVLGARKGSAARRAVLAEPGEHLVSVDLAGIDARVVAGLSGDRAYAELLKDGRDIHAEIAAEFFGDSSRRVAAKAITHGINYGRGAAAVASTTGRPLDEVEDFIARYFQRFPQIARWQREVRAEAETARELATGTGRTVAVDIDRAHTQAPGRLGQAVARNLAATGLLRVMSSNLASRVRLFIHDEVVLSVPADTAFDYAQRAATLLTFPWQSPSGLEIPIIARPSRKHGPTWADA